MGGISEWENDMSRTVTALYDTKAEADAACQRLTSEVDVEGRAQVLDNGSLEGEQGSTFSTLPLSQEDRPAYSEGIRRGGFLLFAEVDGDEDADRIISILKDTSGVNLEEREKMWRSEGWQSDSTTETSGGADREADAFIGADQSSGSTQNGIIGSAGRRDAERSGPTVRSYVRDTSGN